MTWSSHQVVCAVLMRRWNQDTELHCCWPLQTPLINDILWCNVKISGHRSSWGLFGVSKSASVILGQVYPVPTPSDTPFSCAQGPSLFKVGVGLNVNMCLWCKQRPQCGRRIKRNSLLPAPPLMLVIQHSSQAIHSVQRLSEMLKLCFSSSHKLPQTLKLLQLSVSHLPAVSSPLYWD